MPTRPAHPCGAPSCPALVEVGRYCEKHQANHRADKPVRASRQSRGYTSHYSNHYRPWYLRRHPVCESIHGCEHPAEEIHHIVRLADGGEACDESNCQALCSFHHGLLGGQGGRG
jgi:hypothetical protein